MSYKWLTAREHALERPDTIVGAVTPLAHDAFVFEHTDAGVTRRDLRVEVSPALLKLSDEIIVNAIDNHRRDPRQKFIRLTFESDGVFSVTNDGRTIPIERWEGLERYKPEILFGELMSGENFDDGEARLGGGRNGYGAKIANLLAEWFEVRIVNLDDNLLFRTTEEVLVAFRDGSAAERLSRRATAEPAPLTVLAPNLAVENAAPDGTCDADTVVVLGKRRFRNVAPLVYSQTFAHNLGVTHPPVITRPGKTDKASSTSVRWRVDLPRIGMCAPLAPEIVDLLRVRAYDTAACTGAKLAVSVNEQPVPFASLRDYALALGGEWIGRETRAAPSGASLDVCLLYASSSPQLVGFVNGLRCSAGAHVDAVLRALADVVSAAVSKRRKETVRVRPVTLRERLTVVVAALLVNPRFTSQTKEKLDTQSLGVDFELSPKTANAVEKSGLVDHFCTQLEAHDERAVERSVRKKRAPLVPKYEPALKLSARRTPHTPPFSLYVTEGDSAKGLAVAGFSVVGREHNGVFPLRGKLVNVHGMSAKAALEHKEIMALTQILGLNPQVNYAPDTPLPYDHLVIFVDQDHDGSHIMGLLLNWLQTFYPSLLAAKPNFIQRFATPIVRAKVSGETAAFFSQAAYRQWLGDRAPQSVKYFKGLGTSSVDDAKRYFRDIASHRIAVGHTGAPCAAAVDAFFNPAQTHTRKLLLRDADADAQLDYAAAHTTVREFCHVELAQFGVADNRRSLASAVDGLKPSQRKALFAALQRKAGEVKVAQFAAAAAELTAYHHGEVSMVQTVVAMAQPWMGANNLALLKPNGMFGSRHTPRTEHSAPRYIFTERHPIARLLFPAADDAVLEHAEDDGVRVEPRVYAPVIPFLLVNGSDGIGTGWNNRVPAYDPRALIECTRRLIDDAHAALPPLVPHYSGFKGEVEVVGAQHVDFWGVVEAVGVEELVVRELPPKKWTAGYVEWLRKQGDDFCVADVRDHSTHDEVELHLKLRAPVEVSRALLRELGLHARVSLQHLNFFDADDRLVHYDTVDELVRRHAEFRRAVYVRRREHQLRALAHEAQLAANRARFVREVRARTLEPATMDESELRATLREREYYDYDDFAYLAHVALFALTHTAAAKLESAAATLTAQVATLQKTTPEMLWHADLDALGAGLDAYDAEYAYDAKHPPEPVVKKKRRRGARE